MAASINRVDEGTITIAHGFTAGGTYAGIKTYSEDKMDIGMLVSDRPCTAAGVFTTSSIVSPTVTANRETLAAGHLLRGLVVNSGIANAGVGEQGYIDAKGMAALGAEAARGEARRDAGVQHRHHRRGAAYDAHQDRGGANRVVRSRAAMTWPGR